MAKEYDFTESIPSPYVKKLKKPVAVGLEEDVVNYSKALAQDTDIPYPTLINLYLKDCMRTQRAESLRGADPPDDRL